MLIVGVVDRHEAYNIKNIRRRVNEKKDKWQSTGSMCSMQLLYSQYARRV